MVSFIDTAYEGVRSWNMCTDNCTTVRLIFYVSILWAYYETKYSILIQVDLTIKTVEFNIYEYSNIQSSKDIIFALTNQIKCILLH